MLIFISLKHFANEALLVDLLDAHLMPLHLIDDKPEKAGYLSGIKKGQTYSFHYKIKYLSRLGDISPNSIRLTTKITIPNANGN